MRDADDMRASHAPSTGAPAFVGTFVSLVALIMGFLILDLALARAERSASMQRAARLYADGNALLASHPHEASDRFASAHAIDHSDARYALGLAQALMADGRNEEAEQTLEDALTTAANAGPLHLETARLFEQIGAMLAVLEQHPGGLVPQVHRARQRVEGGRER
jgi:tetratricopeptide (TPR) repeat protein